MSKLIQENVPLHDLTTLRVGGLARYFAEVKTIEDLNEVRQFVIDNELSYFVLGGGSNVLVDDGGYDGLIIRNRILGKNYRNLGDTDVALKCGAGEVLDEVISDTVNRGYWGLENLSAIPGTIGATPVQNVGAYGVEVSGLIESVEAFNFDDGTIRSFENEDCEFSYRDSFFKTDKGRKYVIVSVEFKLSVLSKYNLEYKDLKNTFADNSSPVQVEIRKAVIEIRSKKFPDWHKVGTAGSFFKNPIVSSEEALSLQSKFPDLPVYNLDDDKAKLSLGYILDKICGLKGLRVGEVGLYEKQAMVLVNYGEKNFEAVKNFSDEISKKVFEKTKIKIEPEVFFLNKK